MKTIDTLNQLDPLNPVNPLQLVFISDTHGLHDLVSIPECDILLHSGDYSSHGTVKEFHEFLYWLDKQPAKHKVFISGNHDIYAYENFNQAPGELKKYVQDHYENIHYLEDSSVTIEGYEIYGSPWSPKFFDWAFMYERGTHPYNIPSTTQILLTHTPPKSLGDLVTYKGVISSVGCEQLFEIVKELPHLRFSLFGHIHEGYGVYTIEESKAMFLNASICNTRYVPCNKPLLANIDPIYEE